MKCVECGKELTSDNKKRCDRCDDLYCNECAEYEIEPCSMCDRNICNASCHDYCEKHEKVFCQDECKCPLCVEELEENK